MSNTESVMCRDPDIRDRLTRMEQIQITLAEGQGHLSELMKDLADQRAEWRVLSDRVSGFYRAVRDIETRLRSLEPQVNTNSVAREIGTRAAVLISSSASSLIVGLLVWYFTTRGG